MPQYKGEGKVDFKKFKKTIAEIVNPVADAVSGEVKVVKSLTGSGGSRINGSGIHTDAFNKILQT